MPPVANVEAPARVSMPCEYSNSVSLRTAETTKKPLKVASEALITNMTAPVEAPLGESVFTVTI